jgi:hypothetical protein
MASHEHIYEILANGEQVLGQVWWDAEKKVLDSDNSKLLGYLKEKSYNNITYHDGVKFLQHLGRMLKNGYIHARRMS